MPVRRGSSRPTLVIGEALIDVVRTPDGGSSEHVGGSPLNVAVGLARLGHPVCLATHIGRDDRGAAIGAHLAEAGVGLAPGSDNAPDTPVATATLDAQGGADYAFEITWRMPERPALSGHLHTGSISALMGPGGVDVLAAMDGGRHTGTVSYDPNVRPGLMRDRERILEEIERRVALSDVVKASEEDLSWLAGRSLAPDEVADQLRAWRALGPALVVATLGAKGAVAALPSGRFVLLPGREVTVADTVGAGDAFMSGLLSWLLDAGLLGGVGARKRLRKSKDEVLTAAVQRGIDASGVTVTRPGAQPPNRADLGIDAVR